MSFIRLWVDDQRQPPSDYNAHAKTFEEAMAYLKSGRVSVISLDHDLGEEKTGYDIAKWIEEKAFHGEIRPIIWFVHAANPPGAQLIRLAMSKADEYWGRNRETGKVEI